MGKKAVVLLLGFLLAGSWLMAQWQASLKYGFRPAFNTLLYLQAPADLEAQQRIPYEIGFRPKGSYRYALTKKGTLVSAPGQIYLLPFQIPEGEYDVEIDLNASRTPIIETSYTSLGTPRVFEASDLFLSYAPIKDLPAKEPFLGEEWAGGKEVYFFLEFYSPVYPLLTARAVLYESSQEKGATPSTTFSSRQQISRVISLSKGQGSFSGAFDLSSLPDGRFLVEILIFKEGVQIGEKSARFVIPWKGLQRVYSDLPASIEQLVYLAPGNSLHAMQERIAPEAQKEAFAAFWEKLYPGEAEVQMEQYYRKIYEAEARFGCWNCDQARTFVLYGEAEIAPFSQGSHKFERWSYPNWGISFLFEQQGKIFHLLK